VSTADLAATITAIIGELGPADPDAAIDRLVRFLSTADRVFQRVDDSTGRLQDVYHEAAAAVPGLVGQLDETRKASIPDRLLPLAIIDAYDFAATFLPGVIAHLLPEAVERCDARLREQIHSLGAIREKDRQKRAEKSRLTRLRQMIADYRRDVDAFIALETSQPDALCDTMAIAERLFEAGRHAEALGWVRKRGRPGLKIMTYDDLADGSGPRDYSELARVCLEIRILEAMGDRSAAQDLRWTTFETRLDAGMLRDHLAHLPDFAEFDVLDKAFAHASGFAQKYRALVFFVNWPRLDRAAKLVCEHLADWDGRHYEVLLPAAESLEADHPEAATILYRALLGDILDRARSPAYGHAARYLAKLDALAAHQDATRTIDPHAAYRAALAKKHSRKAGFWSLVKERQ
jgi:hypothetical protein